MPAPTRCARRCSSSRARNPRFSFSSLSTASADSSLSSPTTALRSGCRARFFPPCRVYPCGRALSGCPRRQSGLRQLAGPWSQQHRGLRHQCSLGFTGGRHHRVIEFLIFTAINVVSGAAGIFAGPMLRGVLGTSWWLAQASLIVTSALVNFVCRKFLVFKH